MISKPDTGWREEVVWKIVVPVSAIVICPDRARDMNFVVSIVNKPNKQKRAIRRIVAARSLDQTIDSSLGHYYLERAKDDQNCQGQNREFNYIFDHIGSFTRQVRRGSPVI